MIYPSKIKAKKSEKIIQIILIISIVIVVLLKIINNLTLPNIPWSSFVNSGIIYIWIAVIYSIRKNINIAGNILLELIVISGIVLYIDKEMNFIGWSLRLAIPIAIGTANMTMLILTIINYKKYIKYAIYQLVIILYSVIVTISLIIYLTEHRFFCISALIITGVNLIMSLVLSHKDIKEVIIRKFHL